MVAAERLGCERRTRAEMLADLFNAARCRSASRGTSGKSTVTGMIGWILRATDRDPTVMNGAVMKNFATPNAPFASALVGGGDAFVSEVDESDGSIALFAPRVAVLNNVSLDHKSLEELNQLFGDFIAKAELAVINLDNPDGAALAGTLPARQVIGFGIDSDAEFTARDIEERPFGASFTLVVRGSRPAAGRASGAGAPQHLQRARRDRRRALRRGRARRGGAGDRRIHRAAPPLRFGRRNARRRGARRFRPQPRQDRRDARDAPRLSRALARSCSSRTATARSR